MHARRSLAAGERKLSWLGSASIPRRGWALWFCGGQRCGGAMYRGGYGTQNRQYNSSSFNQGYQVCFTTIVRSPRPLRPYRRVTHLSVPLNHGSTYLP